MIYSMPIGKISFFFELFCNVLSSKMHKLKKDMLIKSYSEKIIATLRNRQHCRINVIRRKTCNYSDEQALLWNIIIKRTLPVKMV